MNKSTGHTIFRREFIEALLSTLSPHKAVTLSEDATVSEGLQKLAENQIGSLVILDTKNELKAIVTERDILSKFDSLVSKQPEANILSIASRGPEWLKENASIARALFLMSSGGFRHLPIKVRNSGDWHIISSKDFLDRIHARLTSKILDPALRFDFDTNQVDDFFGSDLGILRAAPALTLRAEDSAEKALAMMLSRHCGSVVVTTASSKVLGIFTERDFVRKIAARHTNPAITKLSDVMTKNPVTLQARASVAYAFSQMSEKGFRHLPIVSDDEQLVGVLSVRSFIDYLSHSIIKELENAKPRS